MESEHKHIKTFFFFYKFHNELFSLFLWQGENIINIELDMPNRTTRDYEGPTVAPKVQAALDAALQDEDDIDIDGA